MAEIESLLNKSIEHIISTALVIFFIGSLIHIIETYMDKIKDKKKLDGMGMARAKFYDGMIVIVPFFIIVSIMMGFFVKWEIKVLSVPLLFGIYYFSMMMTLKPIKYGNLEYTKIQ